jgi:trigger factor
MKEPTLKIESQPQDNCTLALSVEVEDERVQPALKAAARRLAKQYRFPGFRPGKAPYETVLRQVGEAAVYNEALEKLGQEVYQEALEQEKIEAFAPGELQEVQFKPMVLKFNVPLRPEVELGDYRANLRVDYAAPEVTDEAVQESMDHLREHQSELTPVERPAQLGDVVTLDAKGYLNDGENPSDFLLADKDVALVLDEAADWPMPGFAPMVVGMTAGEEKKFDLTFPDTYPNDSLKGQLAHFEVTAKEVKQRALPEWTDELAKSFGDYENLDDLRAKVRADLVAQAEQSTRREYSDKVVNQLTETAQIKYPPVLMEQELDEYLEDLDRRLREQRLTLEDYLKIQGKSKEVFREEVRPQAETRLKRTLVLGKVVDLEGLTVEEHEIEQAIDKLSTPWGEQAGEMRKVLSSDRARRMVSLDVLSDKAVDRLLAVAKGEELPPLPERPHTHDHDHDHTHEHGEAEPEASAGAEPAVTENLSVAEPAQPEGEAAASTES